MSVAEQTLRLEQLQVGIYVYLDLGWMDHPFSFSSFKIRTQEQLDTLRGLGLSTVRWDPARSDVQPLPVRTAGPAPSTASETKATSGDNVAQMAAKQERVQRLAEHREKMARVQQAFNAVAGVVRDINRSIYSQPEKTLAQADKMISDISTALLDAPDLAIYAMAEKPESEEIYFHSLNVAILSMILARELHLPAEVVKLLGVGAMFHDVGLNDVPSKILLNTGTLTKPEREFREQHCDFGLAIGKKAGLPRPLLNIIHQHHEHFDGSGYPQHLAGDKIDPLARIVALVNAFDSLCNPVNIAKAMTPHEALSLMFAQQRRQFDPRALQTFIRFMGVYPPGTVVALSNDAIGLVVNVNPVRPLKPTIIVYDAGIPKQEAIMLDLNDEPDINISRAIRPGQLPPAIYEYLNPRRRVTYFFDQGVKAER